VYQTFTAKSVGEMILKVG